MKQVSSDSRGEEVGTPGNVDGQECGPLHLAHSTDRVADGIYSSANGIYSGANQT